jgi:hypothetical protein
MAQQINFHTVLEVQRGIDGSLLEESAAIWCVLLDAQHATWSWKGVTGGDYLEIGTLHGKSASILASFSRAYGNALTIVDPEIPQATRRTLDALTPKVNYIESNSEYLLYSQYHMQNIRKVAFAHIDGMHRFSAVASDLRICEDALANFGIISVDDFHTDLYPQIPAATYKYLFSGMSDLCMFLVGMNKAYLCRNCAKKYYFSFVAKQLLPVLENMGIRLTLVKSDSNHSFDAFGISRFHEGRFYGDEHPSR